VPRRFGPWQILSSRSIYRDPWIELDQDSVLRPDGQPGTHCVVRMKAGVSVLALDDEHLVYLTDEFHYAIGRQGIEAVSGGIEAGEDPLVTAQRELAEELGIVAERWTPLGVVDPFTTIIVSPTTLFLAESLSFVDRHPEGTELIRVVKCPLDEALAMVDDGRITHAPTCVLLLKVALSRAAR
jgi:ADP-ribose pyrophosphatase